jgi:hypothetical protein
VQPYPSEQSGEYWDDFEHKCAELAVEAHRLDLPNWQTFRYAARTGYDIGAGILSPEASKFKHLAEFRTELGLNPPPPTTGALKGAFCIPYALFGDRLWWPNYLNEPEQRQDEMIRQTLLRGYNHGEIQVSGVPYPGYPEIPLDSNLLRSGLAKMRAAGLQTVVAFRDDRGPNLSYLRGIIDINADLIDWCMGVYECNGVFQDPGIVLDVLKQSRALLPNVKLAVHFTAQDPGTESYGLVDWARAKSEANLNAYFFQVSGWLNNGLNNGIVRIADWTRRLMAGFHGYPILSEGVIDFENTTTRTFRNEWTEAQGVAYTDALMNAPLAPDGGVLSVRPAGYCDGGSV